MKRLRKLYAPTTDYAWWPDYVWAFHDREEIGPTGPRAAAARLRANGELTAWWPEF